MKLQGNIKDSKGEILPFANIFLSDSAGKPIARIIGTQSDINGNYILDNVNIDVYVTFQFVGFKTKTVKVSDIVSELYPYSVNVNLDTLELPYNATMYSDSEALPEFTVIAKKPKWWLYILIGLVSVIIIYYLYKRFK